MPGSGGPFGGNGGIGIPRPPGAAAVRIRSEREATRGTYGVSFLEAYRAYRMVVVGYLQGSRMEGAS